MTNYKQFIEQLRSGWTNFSYLSLPGINLANEELSKINLIGSNLRGADLRGANLHGAKLSQSNLEGANLSNVNLSGADLEGATLINANLEGANLSRAILRGANLSNANLRWADLRGSILMLSYLKGANLTRVTADNATVGYYLVPPEKGEYTAYKACSKFIVELLIPETAKRSSATTRKCRAEEALVLGIYHKDRTVATVTEVRSKYDSSFKYHVGETVKVENFDTDRWIECSSGIHHFLTFEEAVNWRY